MRINGIEMQAEPGATILSVARGAGIEIPGLCTADGVEPYNACMLCLVELGSSGPLVPACSYPANRADEVSTTSPRVTAATKRGVELLLTEHRGDCEAPCTRSCPAGMDIPKVIRLIEAGEIDGAIALAREGVVLPGVMGRICPAPCERACRRKRFDESIRIRHLESFIASAGADIDTAKSASERLGGISMAVVGAGPAGLSAASCIAGEGHRVTVYDSGERPGGALRSGVTRTALPEQVLDSDIESIRRRDVVFVSQCTVGVDMSIDELSKRYDAVVVTVEIPGIDEENRHVFVADRVPPAAARQAIRAVARGRAAARLALASAAVTAKPAKQFDSRYGPLSDNEYALFVATSGADTQRREPAESVQTQDEARAEARRCLGCDCAAKLDCGLREHATRYAAEISGYRGIDRAPFSRSVASSRLRGSGSVVFEASKCIRCGICVRIVESEGVSPGFGFIGRSYGMRVLPPFGEDPGVALGEAAPGCITACPTGALSYGHGVNG